MQRKLFLNFYAFGVSLGLLCCLNAHAMGGMSDTTPNPFTFTDQTAVALNSAITSNTITVSGINAKASISISGGSFSINNGSFRTSSTTISNGNTVNVKLTSSASYSATTNATLTIGGVSDTFSLTTLANPSADTTPNAFSFTDQTGVALNTAITSNTITVSGINAASPISISGGSYAVNGGAFTTASGTVANGATVQVKQTSSANYSTATNATLTIGGVSDIFTATTQAQPATGFILPPASPGNPSFSSEHFMGSSVCANCHNGIKDANNNDVSIETDWSSTMMGNSARDPLWRAKVRSEINRNPQLASVINDKCTRCHAPMANFEAKSYNEPKAILDGGFLDASHPRHDEALNGVSCTLCHQIQNAPNLGTLDSFTGHYEIGNNKEIFGPYTNPFGNPMIMQTGYTPVYSAHIQSSKICGTCHNLKTPYVDQFGQVLSTTPESEFPEQMPYSEWENSSYATTNPQSCQQCHMSRTNGVKISTMPMMLGTRDNFAIHEFVGGNRLMLDVFNNNKQQLGVLSNNFPETIAKTQTMLSSAANIATVSQSLGADNVLNFTLQINSTTGHKLPTAYPSRRVILHVTVKDAGGNTVFESGKVNADGRVVGVDADVNNTTFEPHYDVITQASQVQVYEAIMGDNEGNVTYTLLRGMVYLKDNRLLPTGFNKATAPHDVKVFGDALNDNDFVGGSDQVTYQISGLTGNNYTVEAELIHQPLAYSFAQDLFTEIDGEVEDFKTMFEASDKKSTQITLKTFSVAR